MLTGPMTIRLVSWRGERPVVASERFEEGVVRWSLSGWGRRGCWTEAAWSVASAVKSDLVQRDRGFAVCDFPASVERVMFARVCQDQMKRQQDVCLIVSRESNGGGGEVIAWGGGSVVIARTLEDAVTDLMSDRNRLFELAMNPSGYCSVSVQRRVRVDLDRVGGQVVFAFDYLVLAEMFDSLSRHNTFEVSCLDDGLWC